MIKNFTLIKKEKLTPDVFKLVFNSNWIKKITPWEFITFLLPKTWFGRAYSIFDFENWNIYFIIKRLENGRWWSKELCDYDEWIVLRWVWPTWHFKIKDETKNSLFIWTWTWIVPLFFMAKNILNSNSFLKILWWNRKKKDLYIIKELDELVWNSFNYDLVLSQEKLYNYNYLRVWDLLTWEYIKDFTYFYICWNLNMVNDVIEKLQTLWIEQDKIITEKY